MVGAIRRENLSRCHASNLDLNTGTIGRSIANMTTRFEVRKHNILEQLDAPAGDYHDLSPKGSIDEPIRTLIGEINNLDGLVTTSSCSGRISVFLEGRKAAHEGTELVAENEESRAGPGGKGGGGAWLFISHTAVEISNATSSSDFMSLFGLQKQTTGDVVGPSVSSRYIHLKFEPMVLPDCLRS